MKIIDYLINKMEENEITDVFGIPGGVVLDFIYAVNESENIDIHLNYNEQMAAYAACGYSQASGKIGVVYTTKGPGFTNVYTPMVEAYGDSLPVLFITAHSQKEHNSSVRIEEEQEINHVAMATLTTKYAVRVDEPEIAKKAIDEAFCKLSSSRKGPVLLDFHSSVFMRELKDNEPSNVEVVDKSQEDGVIQLCCNTIKHVIGESSRPIILIGDGLRNSPNLFMLEKVALQNNIPVISSRVSEDLLLGSDIYYGYIGSHGLRYSNFILSKADCIICLANRLGVNKLSETWRPILENASFVRIDIDSNELKRDVVDSLDFCLDANDVLSCIVEENLNYNNSEEWIDICNEMREKLFDYDMPEGALCLAEIIRSFKECNIIVNDVGNNELWTSRVLPWTGKGDVRFLLSKTLKTVGSALGKAIGAYYSDNKPVMCIIGDEGLQYNIQELQYIYANKLPIVIVVWNNHSLGMLKDNETNRKYSYYLHTTIDSGYSVPNLEKIICAYGIEYVKWSDNKVTECCHDINHPVVIELIVDEEKNVLPKLPRGNACMDFIPQIESELYEKLSVL